MDGMDQLDGLFERLPKVAGEDGEFRMYVDRSYNVQGVGAVASGTIKSGTVGAGDELLLGPMQDGSFRPVTVRSIGCTTTASTRPARVASSASR